MKCPVCDSTLDEGRKPHLVFRIVGLLSGTGIEQDVKLRCAKCRTEVRTPPLAQVLHGETIEDFRKSCVGYLAGIGNRKLLLGGFWTAAEQSLVDQYERHVRILDAMTPEEREVTEPPGPEQREHLALASGSTREDVEQTFNEFTIHREIIQKARVAKFPWQAMIPGAILVPFFVAPMFIQLTGDAAAVVSGFGYYLVAVLLLFGCLTRLKNASRLVYSSWLRIAAFGFLLPGALATGAVWLIHEQVVRAGWEQIPLTFGFISIGLLFGWAYSKISSVLMMRRIRRQQMNAK